MVTTNIFQSLSEKAKFAEIDSRDSKEARAWYRSQASRVASVNYRDIIDNKNIRTALTNNNIGQMFMFFYSPKHKQTLPFYDIFPLVFPVELYNNGFLGINFHYLPHNYRAKLMDALYFTINNNKNDSTTKLDLSYQILKGTTGLRYFKPCLKRYLYSNVLRKFLYIETEDWEKCLFLPTERFVKQSKDYVHTQSVKSITGQ